MAKNTSPETKAQIIVLKKLRYSDRAVAKILGNVHLTTVSRIYNKYCGDHSVHEKTPCTGWPRKLTRENVWYAALSLIRARSHNISTLQRVYFPHISTSTLRCYLRELGFRTFRHCRVPHLKLRHKHACLGWAWARLHWSQLQWDDIIFSNETRIVLFGSDGHYLYWKHPYKSPYDPRFTKQMTAHGGGGIFVWGCISWEGIGQLHCIKGVMTAERYIEILGTSFFRSLSNWRISLFDITFQHDQDPKHMARMTQRWLFAKGVKVLPWPARSPDLNIIKHVWFHLKQRICSRSSQPTNVEDLWLAAEEEWNMITPE
jgi:transposase